MAWKCPNCETINQGKTCVVCGAPCPDAEPVKPVRKVSPVIIALIAAVAIGVTGMIAGIALSHREKPIEPVVPSETEHTKSENNDTEKEETEVRTDESDTSAPDTEPEVTETEAPVESEKNPETDAPATEVKAEIISVSLDRDNITLNAGESIRLNGSIRHIGDTDNTVNWKSSDSKIALVSHDGTVVGVSEGKCTVTMVASNGMTADCAVNVKGIPVSSVTIADPKITLTAGESKKLTASVLPANATYKTVSWKSSNTKVAKVGSDGTVTAISEGSASVTASSANGKTAVCSVTVTKKTIAVKSVKLNRDSAELNVGDKLALTATVSPSDAADKSVKWSSSASKVASVDSKGNVTALKAGKAVISVTTSNGLSAKCTVTVKEIKVESIALSGSKLTLEVGDTWQIEAKIKPESASSKITWSSSNEKAVSCVNGLITAKSSGSAVIRATAEGGAYAECTVTVASNDIPVKSIALDVNNLTLKAGGEYTFKVSVLPSDATDKKISWRVSDTSLLTVDAGGHIRAVAPGTVVVTAVTSNGFSDACIVIISEAQSIIEKDFDYTAENGTIRITGYKGTAANVVIPEKIEDKNVSSIGNGAFSGTPIVKVELPDTVEYIGDSAFEYCSQLQEITIPAKLKMIGTRAFARTAIHDIALPRTVEYIGYGAFSYCTSLDAVEIDRNNPYYFSYQGAVFADNGNVLLAIPGGMAGEVQINAIEEVAPYAFAGCSRLASVEFLNGLKSIGDSAFEGCSSLTTLGLCDSVESLGRNAIAGCSSLTEFRVPANVVTIMSGTFSGCTSLEYIHIGNNISFIADDAFTGCSGFGFVCDENSVANYYGLLRGIAVFRPGEIY